MPSREDHEVHKDMWGHWREKKNFLWVVKKTKCALIQALRLCKAVRPIGRIEV